MKIGWHELAAEATISNARNDGVVVGETTAASLLGLCRAWDGIEAAHGPYGVLPALAREIRLIVESFRPMATGEASDLWAQLERDISR